MSYAPLGSNTPIIGGVAAARGVFFGSAGYQQPIPHGYPRAYFYPPYGYASYGPENVYQQGIYNPYAGQQYFQYHGLPGTSTLGVYPYGNIGQSILGSQPIQGYMMGQQIMQYGGGPSVNLTANSSFPTVRMAYHAGISPTTAQVHPQYVIPVHPQVIKIGEGDQIAR